MKKMNLFHCLPLVLFTFLLRLGRVCSVLSLQLPGLNFGTGDPTTVDIEFLDKSGSSIYVVKGEVFSQTMPRYAINNFYPNRLLGESVKYAAKMRIRAAEIGMTLRLFDINSKSMPKLYLFIKESFIVPDDQAIEIDLFESEVIVRDNPKFDLTWYGRNKDEMSTMGGLHIDRIEVHVSRVDNAQLVPIPSFIPIGVDNNNSPALALNAAVNGGSGSSPSLVRSNNVAVLQNNQNIQPIQVAMVNPAGAQFPQP